MARYSNLQPLSLDEQATITTFAIDFFSGLQNKKYRNYLKLPINPERLQPLTLGNFLNWYEKEHDQEIYSKMQRVVELIGMLSRKKCLISAGHGQGSPPLCESYYSMLELSCIEAKGVLFLGKFLGLRHIANATKGNLACITGKTPKGDEHIGSGILITPNIVLTCAHVLNDMQIDAHLKINGHSYKIDDHESHPEIDFGTIIIKEDIKHKFCNDIALRNSEVLEPIVIIGFPKVPRKLDSSPITQSGEIAGRINSYSEKNTNIQLELFTAIARPGNSGGPLLSEDGKLLGIVTQSLERQKEETDRENQILPCFAAVPSSEIFRGFKELEIAQNYHIPWEDYQ